MTPGHDPAEEAERRRQKRGLESQARHGQIPDPAHVVKVSTPDRPGAWLYLLARWSTEGRLVSDAAEPGALPGQAVDLGPLPLHLTGPPGAMLIIGVRHHGRWASITRGCEALAAACLDLERSRSLTVRWPRGPSTLCGPGLSVTRAARQAPRVLSANHNNPAQSKGPRHDNPPARSNN